MHSPYGILFVCLGNICRSPLAEGLFRAQLEEDESLRARLLVDSCGTGEWHVGKPPHIESQNVARSFGIDISAQRARRLSSEDTKDFSLFIAMDRANKNDIQSMLGEGIKVHCLREFDPERSPSDRDALDVPDPYFGAVDGFKEVAIIINRSIEPLLEHIRQELAE